MHAKSWIIGLTLALGGLASAQAGSMASVDLGSNIQASDARAASQDGVHDGTGYAQDCPPPREASSDTISHDASRSTHHPGGDVAAPPSTPRHNLGWQSLLPGSIQ